VPVLVGKTSQEKFGGIVAAMNYILQEGVAYAATSLTASVEAGAVDLLAGWHVCTGLNCDGQS